MFLGPHAFETIGGEVVNVALVSVTGTPPMSGQDFTGVDVIGEGTPSTKADRLLSKAIGKQNQEAQLRNPNSRITLELLRGESYLKNLSIVFKGFRLVIILE